MAARFRKPCFDSSVFVGGLNKEIVNRVKRRVVLDYLWERAKAGDFQVFISAFCLAETFKKRRGPSLKEGKCYEEFLDFINEDFVQVIEIDREIGLHAHELCRRFRANSLMPGDAVHLACAIRAGCDVLLAWNGPLNTVTLDEIKIEEPHIWEPSMFEKSEMATDEGIAAYEAKNPQPVKPSPAGVSGGIVRPAQSEATAKAKEGTAQKEG